MRTAFAIGLGALCWCSAAYAEESATKVEWFTCEKNHDCGRTETACGDPIAINLKHYKEYSAYIKAARASTQCEPGKKVTNLRELHSVCSGNACSFDPAPQYGSH